MLNFSPSKAFISVDLPAFGFPMMFTKPARCLFSKFLKLLFCGNKISLYLHPSNRKHSRKRE